jgi:YD repeat-containing protein
MADHRSSPCYAVKLLHCAGVLCIGIVLPLLCGSWAPAADIDYVYDELGRLRAVIGPNSDTAVYNYDAVGNLLSISRQATSVVSIIDFSPKLGPVGTNVTIYGTGFSATQ